MSEQSVSVPSEAPVAVESVVAPAVAGDAPAVAVSPAVAATPDAAAAPVAAASPDAATTPIATAAPAISVPPVAPPVQPTPPVAAAPVAAAPVAAAPVAAAAPTTPIAVATPVAASVASSMGETVVEREVVEKIAAAAARSVPGVADLGGDVARFLDTILDKVGLDEVGDATRGVHAVVKGIEAKVTVVLVLKADGVVPDVTSAVRAAVVDALQKYGLQVTGVDIKVDDITMD